MRASVFSLLGLLLALTSVPAAQAGQHSLTDLTGLKCEFQWFYSPTNTFSYHFPTYGYNADLGALLSSICYTDNGWMCSGQIDRFLTSFNPSGERVEFFGKIAISNPDLRDVKISLASDQGGDAELCEMNKAGACVEIDKGRCEITWKADSSVPGPLDPKIEYAVPLPTDACELKGVKYILGTVLGWKKGYELTLVSWQVNRPDVLATVRGAFGQVTCGFGVRRDKNGKCFIGSGGCY